MLACAIGSCQHSKYRSVQGATWGTTYHITYCADRSLDDSIVAVMHQIDMSLSPFAQGSLVSRINSGDTATRADAMLREVVGLSQRVCSLSHGAFDPTVAPLVNLWGFGYKTSGMEPTRQQIDSALAWVGILDCRIDADGRVHKKSPNTEFNFSAIAKGYGVDKIAEMLSRNGVEHYMVEVGGEIALSGLSPRGTVWNIQLDAPVPDPQGEAQHNQLQVLPITDRCIATSGNYRNYRLLPDGSVASHTISPATGLPVRSSTLSATILAPSTAIADALATAVMAMSSDSALAMLKPLADIDYIIVSAAPDSTYRITTSLPAK